MVVLLLPSLSSSMALQGAKPYRWITNPASGGSSLAGGATVRAGIIRRIASINTLSFQRSRCFPRGLGLTGSPSRICHNLKFIINDLGTDKIKYKAFSIFSKPINNIDETTWIRKKFSQTFFFPHWLSSKNLNFCLNNYCAVRVFLPQ